MTATTVVLDRDGTLLDFYEMFHRFILDLHREQGAPPPGREEILSHSYWTAITSGRLHIGRVRVRDRVDDVIRRYMPHGTLYEGAVPALGALKAARVRLALVSSWIGTPQTRALLRAHGVADCFGPVLTRDDLPVSPSPVSDTQAKLTLARRALDRLGHRTGDRLFVVGDTPDDVALGRRLGAVVVGVRTGNGRMLPDTPEEGPDILLPSVAGLAELVLATPREAS
ncbi:HAD family hydrolase [Streptomyces sp. NPDC001135]